MGQHLHILELLEIRVTPDDDPAGSGILVDGSLSLPFTLERQWSGNMGYYFEQYVIQVGDRRVFDSVPRQIFVRGLQSRTSYRDHVDERIQLEPGTCQMHFLIDDVPMAIVELPVRALTPA